MRINSKDAVMISSSIRSRPSTGVEDAIAGARGRQEASIPAEFEKREAAVSEKMVANAIDKANKAIAGYDRKFEYSVHEVTKDIIVKVINTETNEVIREIPPEKILDLVAKLWALAGIIVDERR